MMPKLLVAAALLLAASHLLADQVVLNNGDRLTGTIVKSDGKDLVLKTDYAGEITIHWDALQGLRPPGTAAHPRRARSAGRWPPAPGSAPRRSPASG